MENHTKYAPKPRQNNTSNAHQKRNRHNKTNNLEDLPITSHQSPIVNHQAWKITPNTHQTHTKSTRHQKRNKQNQRPRQIKRNTKLPVTNHQPPDDKLKETSQIRRNQTIRKQTEQKKG
jgi:hypothetical protein